MGEVGRARLEAELGRHYAQQRETACPDTIDDLASAMVAEDARASEASDKVPSGCARASEASDKVPSGCARASEASDKAPLGLAAFVAAQVRYIPAWTWVAQAALVALMGALAFAAGGTAATKASVGMLATASVLAGTPAVHSSKRYRVAELEYACPYDAASVMVARLIVMGCASALTVGLMVAAAASSLDASAFVVALWACPPFFCSCAGALALLRKAAPSTAVAMSAIWAAACSATLLVVATVFPEAYGNASLGIWAAAAACALAWLAREVAMTCRAATAGLDAFSPHMAKTYN